MLIKVLLRTLSAALVIVLVLAGIGMSAQVAGAAPKEKVLHSFRAGTDGEQPQAGLVFDAAGNLYGTTVYGGRYGAGTAFRLTRRSDGTWKEKVIHSFGKGRDGSQPYAGLIVDTAGNLYGTTVQGGGFYSDGTAFQLAPGADGKWKETVLHSFKGPYDGALPFASLILGRL